MKESNNRPADIVRIYDICHQKERMFILSVLYPVTYGGKGIIVIAGILILRIGRFLCPRFGLEERLTIKATKCPGVVKLAKVDCFVSRFRKNLSQRGKIRHYAGLCILLAV